jgi:hypothetical protein
MAHRIAIYDGYGAPFDGYKRRRKSKSRRKSGGSQRAKFGRAARACKGKSAGAFRKCMRSKLKGR